MPFPVPDGYFDGLAQVITDNIAETNSNWGKGNAFEAPEGYFEQLPRQVLAQALIEDTENSFSKAPSYEVPSGYFEALPRQILEKANGKAHRSISIKWWHAARWAAAAILVLGISMGSYKMLKPPPVNTSKALASLPAETIHDYVVQNLDDFDTELIMNSFASDKMIKGAAQLDNQEIIQYLNEEGWEVKTELN
jgi:hypothetical protein